MRCLILKSAGGELSFKKGNVDRLNKCKKIIIIIKGNRNHTFRRQFTYKKNNQVLLGEDIHDEEIRQLWRRVVAFHL